MDSISAIKSGRQFYEAVMQVDRSKKHLSAEAVESELTRIFRGFCAAQVPSLNVQVKFEDVHSMMSLHWHTELACVDYNKGELNIYFHRKLLSFDDSNSGLIFAAKCWVVLIILGIAILRCSLPCAKFIVELGDNGGLESISFCSSAPNACLVADYDFVSSHGYESFRLDCDERLPAWAERKAVAFWRGSTTGRRIAQENFFGEYNGFGWLQRLALCDCARKERIRNLCDVAISSIVQVNDDERRQIQGSGFFLEGIPRKEFSNYRYLVDIDGNSNAWSGLFSSLYGGSCVLKIASIGGYRQWYYPRLKAWREYIPIEMNLSDFEDAIEWAVCNDTHAAEIASRGRELAASISLDAALGDSAENVARWLRSKVDAGRADTYV